MIDKLIAQRSKKIKERDFQVQKYKNILSILGKKNGKKDLNNAKKKYDLLREEIVEIEDQIADISADKLDEIVVPNPLDIEDAIELLF